MIVCDLVCLGEGVVVSNSRTIVPETPEVGLGSLLLLNVDRHYLYLVVRQPDFNFELSRHNEFVSFDGVVVVLLLLNLLLLLEVTVLIDSSLDVIWILHHLHSNSGKSSSLNKYLLTCASSICPGDISIGA